MTGSVLLEAVRRSGTEFWNDSAGVDDLRRAIDDGATGATTNPPIVLDVVRGEGAAWGDRARALAATHAAWGELEITWAIVEEVAVRGASVLAPVFERSNGERGRLSAQVNPRLHRSATAMVDQAVRLASLAPNIQVKIPVTTAGLEAIEEATFRGVEINATANFTVAGAIAVAETIERGLGRRAAAGLTAGLHPVCTIMVGRLDDWVRAAAARDGVLLTPGRAEWAGVAVFKRAFRVFHERGYRTRLLAGAFRHHLPWTQLLGGDTIATIPPEWQRLLKTSGLPLECRIEEEVSPAILDELHERSPEFAAAYAEDGVGGDELEAYGASRRTMRQFLAAYDELQSTIRDAILPDPARPAA